MVYPVLRYSIKGVLWYQGESNVHEPELYRKLFPAMVESWRQSKDNEFFPFYYVQIAPLKYFGEEKIAAALFREVQLKCRELIPNSEMIVTLDIGEKDNIHPLEKETIGKRLSFAALAKTYGFHELPYKGPALKNKIINGDKITLIFDDVANGLMFTSLEGFELASENKLFMPANAMLKGEDQIELWAEGVNNPTYVRYCFRNYTKGTLFNSHGLPASSFRTDD